MTVNCIMGSELERRNWKNPDVISRGVFEDIDGSAADTRF
ncbi:hypothetical protein SAMN04487913_10991 [Arthrobacter sp. ok362]|nr:hypothetical protein SAMN04487913_10991 [Arthrobacter sp. ok362]